MKNTFTKIMVLTILLSTQSLLAQFSGGSGTEIDPYQITTPSQLDSIRGAILSTQCYILLNDIDLTAYQSGTGWMAIGNDNVFTGKFNGDGHIITGLVINISAPYQGLFGYTTGAEIKNLGVEGVNITGTQWVGGLVGAPDISSKISNCYTTGIVSGTSRVGGLIGASSATDSIANCYSRASVNCTSGSTGGLIGYALGDASTVISNCFSTGALLSAGGGLIGQASGLTATACFWDTETSGKATSAGGAGVVGKTTAEMKTKTTFTDVGWDATGTIWKIDETNAINNGYPFLAWQNPSGNPLPVELTSFTVLANGNSIALSWYTATEVNNYGFEVERRAVNSKSSRQEAGGQATVNSWGKIGFVAGAGTTNSTKEYSFVDSKLDVGRYAYRLKQVDNDGIYKYTTSVEIELKLAPETVGLVQNFPNPFNPSTKISFVVANTEQATLTVYNLLGQKVKTLFDGVAIGQQSYDVSFDGSRLASGIYFYRLETPSRVEVRRMQLLK